MLTEILSSAENFFQTSRTYVCMFILLYVCIIFSRCVCHASFTCMLYQYVLGVRIHVLGVCMFMVSVAACFGMFLHADCNIVFG